MVIELENNNNLIEHESINYREYRNYLGKTGDDISIPERFIVNFNLLCFFDALCRKNNIKYSLTGGTLLGAVRHKGFIPWDDDVDVFLTRPEYEKLKKIPLKDKRYKLYFGELNSDFNYVYGRLIDSKTHILESENTASFGKGLFLDICVVDGMSKYKISRNFDMTVMKLITICRSGTFYSMTGDRFRNKNYLKKLVIRFLQKYTSISFWNRALMKRMHKYSFDNSDYVGNFTSAYGRKEMLHRDVFSSYIEMEFEGESFMVCSGFKEYLKNVYGDYMTLPSIENRVRNHPDIAKWL